MTLLFPCPKTYCPPEPVDVGLEYKGMDRCLIGPPHYGVRRKSEIVTSTEQATADTQMIHIDPHFMEREHLGRGAD